MAEPLDIDDLTEPSRDFARRFVERFPSLASACSSVSIAGVPGNHLRIEVESPAGPERNVVLWMETGSEPSLAFGSSGWHAHNDSYQDLGGGRYVIESLFDLLDAILRDEVVELEELDGPGDPFVDVVDLRTPGALHDRLTSPHGTGRARIRSFSGRVDREVSLNDPAGLELT